MNGARSEGIGQINSVLIDEWSTMNNPASMSFRESSSFAFGYKNTYLLPELGTAGASFQFKAKTSSFGLGFSRYGYQHFSDTRMNLAYSLLLQENIAMGIAFSPQIIRFSNTGARFYPNATISFLAKVSDQVKLGAVLRNPFNQNIDLFSDSYTQSMIQAGASYQLLEELMLAFELEKDLQMKLRPKIGGEFRVQDFAFLRAGIIGSPLEISYGGGLILKQFQIDLALRQNPVLGVSGQAGLHFNLFRNQQNND